MTTYKTMQAFASILAATIMSVPAVHAAVEGIGGTNFTLSAGEGYVSVADGGSIYSWGYSVDGSPMQMPGPTLIVNEGDTVTVTLKNNLPKAAGNVSIIFNGQDAKPCAAADFDPVAGCASGTETGVTGSLTQEAPSSGTVTYTFKATKPGTYQYHSGTRSDLQVEMGLFGALIVRPNAASLAAAACDATPLYADATLRGAAYGHHGACYDREYLFITSSIDLQVHTSVEAQSKGPGPIVLPENAFESSEYWLLNGRVGPDTMAGNFAQNLQHQPYGALARMHPGEKVLVRVVGGGREIHPFHLHGNHTRVIARDGNMLLTTDDITTGKLAGPLLFTIPSIPGTTNDSIWEWTGKDLNWDMYGHAKGSGLTCIDTDGDGYNDTGTAPKHEYCADHEKAMPVVLPSYNNLAFGGFYSGSPFLGDLGSLPPGEGGLNPGAGFAFMWHSHTERELVNNDVFPGGLMTMMIVEAPFVEIAE